MLKVTLINGASFEVQTKDFAKGTSTTTIRRTGYATCYWPITTSFQQTLYNA